MEQVEVKKLSAGTGYKIFSIGLTLGFLPLFLLFVIMGAFGMEGLVWNEQPVTAIKAIFIGPLMAIFMSLMFTAIIGSICALGLWIFTFIKPLNIVFVLS
jgi:hypothetical protein